jgi:hypothetical protein
MTSDGPPGGTCQECETRPGIAAGRESMTLVVQDNLTDVTERSSVHVDPLQRRARGPYMYDL